MKRIALDRTASFNIAPVLTLPDRPCDRLIAWVWTKGSQPGGAAFIEAYVSEGWKVLEANCADSVDDRAGADILRAVEQCHEPNAHLRSEGSAATIFVADRGMAAAVGDAVLSTYRSGRITGRCGLVTIDAFAEDRIPALSRELVGCNDLSTIWAVHRDKRELRQATLAHHARLQSRGRETHFLALPDSGLSLAQQLADPRHPLGREVRWLLDPVHSRSV